MDDVTTQPAEYRGPPEAEAVLEWALRRFNPDIALACSFQMPLLVHMMAETGLPFRLFSIDTGRLPEETYECAAAIEKRYGVTVEWYLPDHSEVERLQRDSGVYSFRDSIEARRACCAVRKVAPLNRALSGLAAWITGVRQDQAETRGEIRQVEFDAAHGGIVKVNPLVGWTSQEVRDYVRAHHVPYNRLLDRGYTSVGCSCCTRAIEPGEHPRAGRWWWEQAEHKECGLHVRNWDI